MGIIGECGKALDAYEDGKIHCLSAYDNAASFGDGMWYGSVRHKAFNWHVKNTFEDHLANIVIRIADLCGEHDVYGSVDNTSYKPYASTCVEWLLLGLVGDVYSSNNDHSGVPDGNRMLYAIDKVFRIASTFSIDLWRHIELRLSYNRVNP